MERILSLAQKKAEEAEVFLISGEETPVVFETNRVKQLQTRQSQLVALRLIRRGKLGFSVATQLDNGEAVVNRAVEASQFGAEAKFDLPSLQTYPPVGVYDPQIESMSIEQMVELGDSLIEKVRQYSPELVCDGVVNKAVFLVRLLNSKGSEASYRKSLFSITLNGTLVKDTDMLFVGDVENSCHPITDPGFVSGSVIKQLELARNRASAPAGQLPVIFTPRGVANAFLTSLAVAFNGRVVCQGASPLGKRRGEQVFAPEFTLWDDATISFCPRSRPCDDEGVPSQRTPLVEKGIVQGFLYDLHTAALANTRSTGSGVRINGGLPTPAPSALIIEEGNTPFEEMVKGVEEGLVVEDLMGAEQTNILGGEFSGNVLLGYKIEGGEIVGRVKDTMVSGNIYQVLGGAVTLGRESRWVMGGILRTPAIYCSRLTVSSRR